MPLNTSGPISLAGSTTGQSIQIELGGNGTTQMSLNDAAVRTLAGVPSGAITMPTDFYGKSNRVAINLTISANQLNYVLNTAKVSGLGYVAGNSDITVTINSGIYVYSNSTGTAGMRVDTSWSAGDTITIINNGIIHGMGGNGGSGGYGSTGGSGSAGGNALTVQRAVSINNGSGVIAGGGGGGGGGGGYYSFCPCTGPLYASGGGGGGGRTGLTNSSGGGGHVPGSPGTSSGPGGGGSGGDRSGSGGSGGARGSSGATGQGGSSGGGGAGGGGGSAVSGNSNITWIATGTRNGAIT